MISNVKMYNMPMPNWCNKNYYSVSKLRVSQRLVYFLMHVMQQ